MENIIIGCIRRKGVMPEDKEKGRKATPFDSMSIYLANYKEMESGAVSAGFLIGKNCVVKIKTQEFQAITGIHPFKFLNKFEELYQFHKARIMLETDKFGRNKIAILRVSRQNCKELYEEEQRLKAELEKDPFSEDFSDASDDYGSDFVDFNDDEINDINDVISEAAERTVPRMDDGSFDEDLVVEEITPEEIDSLDKVTGEVSVKAKEEKKKGFNPFRKN